MVHGCFYFFAIRVVHNRMGCKIGFAFLSNTTIRGHVWLHHNGYQGYSVQCQSKILSTQFCRSNNEGNERYYKFRRRYVLLGRRYVVVEWVLKTFAASLYYIPPYGVVLMGIRSPTREEMVIDSSHEWNIPGFLGNERWRRRTPGQEENRSHQQPRLVHRQ